MNKVKLIFGVFIFIIIFCFIGVFFIQADSEIVGEVDILDIQNEITNNINVYGYSIDNPNVIVNPYGDNYNTALILFETDDYVSVNVNVNNVYNFSSKKTNRHYIGVYNLIEGKNNIVLSYGNVKNNIEIEIIKNENLIDLSNVYVLSNNHFIVSTDKNISDNVYTGVREIDVFGKIYYEYLINDGYYGVSCEIDDEKLAVLSKNLIILDRQNGGVISSYDISKYDYVWEYMEYISDKVILYSEEGNISVDKDGNIDIYDGMYDKKYYNGDVNYLENLGIRFYENIETEMSNLNVWLLNYDKLDKDINIDKEFNRLVISFSDIDSSDVYVIFDKLMDKRVYKLNDNVNYIYTYNFDGKYSVYFKIGDKIYKTDKYLKF